MKATEPAVSMGIAHGAIRGEAYTDLIITKDDRLLLLIREDAVNVDISLGRATKKRIDWLIECFGRIKIHALDE